MQATPILFTWPSRAQLTGYEYDKESTNYSRTALEQSLRVLAADPDVKDITILAHSMQVSRLKRKTILVSLSKLTDFERWSERATLGDNVVGDESEPEVAEFGDVKPVYVASLKTSAMLINKDNVLPVLGPALLPMLVVGASYLPYSQLGPVVKRLLFL